MEIGWRSDGDRMEIGLRDRMEIGAARSLRLGLPLLHHTPRRTERVDPPPHPTSRGPRPIVKGSERTARLLSAYVL